MLMLGLWCVDSKGRFLFAGDLLKVVCLPSFHLLSECPHTLYTLLLLHFTFFHVLSRSWHPYFFFFSFALTSRIVIRRRRCRSLSRRVSGQGRRFSRSPSLILVHKHTKAKKNLICLFARTSCISSDSFSFLNLVDVWIFPHFFCAQIRFLVSSSKKIALTTGFILDNKFKLIFAFTQHFCPFSPLLLLL